MNGACCLLADCLHDSGMSVAESIHSQAGDKVEVLLAVQVEEEDALATLDDQRVAAVGLEQELLFTLDDFFGGRHRETMILPENGVSSLTAQRITE